MTNAYTGLDIPEKWNFSHFLENYLNNEQFCDPRLEQCNPYVLTYQ